MFIHHNAIKDFGISVLLLYSAMEAGECVKFSISFTQSLLNFLLYQVGGYSLCFLVTGGSTTLLSFLVLPAVPKIGEL